MQRAFALRKEVFVDEQGVSPELEIDKHEKEATHFIVKNKISNQIIGTCRLRTINNKAKLERMAIKKEDRKQGLGSMLIHKVISFAKEKDIKKIYLHSQLKAKEFYANSGFEVVSDSTFKEAGIEHVKMNKLI